METIRKSRRSKMRIIQDYLVIAVAMLMASVGWVLFLLPNEITPGGVAGISSIIYWGFHISPSIVYFVVNVILLSFALKF